MPSYITREIPPYHRPVHPAAGLHDPSRSRAFFFEDLTRKASGRALRVGRGVKCDIRLSDTATSRLHAELVRQSDGRTLLKPLLGATNGLYADGNLITEPVLVTVGMRVRFGAALLIGVSEEGRFPFPAETYHEYMRRAGDLYGNNAAAARHIGRSCTAIRLCRLPPHLRDRSRRSKATKAQAKKTSSEKN